MDEDARAFVLHRWAETERLAMVALGDPVAGHEVALGTMTRAVRQWQELQESGLPSRWVRRDLMDAMAPQDAPPDELPEGATMAQTWSALPPRTTAAYVLSEVDHWDPAEVADALGMPVATVGDLVASTHARLARAHARDLDDDHAGPTSFHEALAELVDGAGRPSTRAESALDAISAALRRSRRRGWAIGGGALLTAVAAGIVAFSVATSAVPTPGPTPTVGRSTSPSANSSDGIFAGPARGNLATDPTLLAEVARRFLGTHRLVFADQTDGRVRVIAAPQATARDAMPLVKLLTGPASAPAAELTELDAWYSPDPIRATLAVVDPSTTDRRVIVLTEPDARALDISATVTVNAKGEVHREWTSQTLQDGAGLLDLGGPRPALLLRVAGRQVVPDQATVLGEGMIPCIGCDVPVSPEGLLEATRRDAAGALGADPSNFTPTVVAEVTAAPELATGNPDVTSRLLIARHTLANGVVLQSTGVTTMVSGRQEWAWLNLNEWIRPENVQAPLSIILWGSDSGTRTQIIILDGSPVRAISLVQYGKEGERIPVEQSTVMDVPPTGSGTVLLRAWAADGTLVSERPIDDGSGWDGSWDLYHPE
ncbi:MAG: hypothetical protein M9923_06850 [Phycicoccus sp.]|uniref:RNA polymerase sigma factor n=1 Tax=Phycicoccus sp. TaxID=1902410 RepID=UPI00258F62E2|nr:hypothetical protein [Phycicoccus sp.]MCO5302924.1 hypothetical protein [Phycicoccus sp.]